MFVDPINVPIILVYLLDDPSVTVHGNVFHDVFEGTVYTPDEEYHIEPADRYAPTCGCQTISIKFY